MCQFKFSSMEIEYSIENKVKILFLNFLCLHFAFEFLLNIVWLFFAFTNLLKKLFFSLQFKDIILCYNWHDTLRMTPRIPPPLTWHVFQNIVDSLGPVVFACIMNYSRGHWLLSDALNFAISMSLNFKDEIDSTTCDNLMK